jgi:hypothetical protein
MNRDHEFELRLAEAAHTESELRRIVDILLAEGDAVFASRSWRWGRRLTGIAAALLRPFGVASPPAQDAAHWHRIVAAHDDALRRRRLLLEQLAADPAREVDVAELLATLWREAGDERVRREP